MTPLRLSGILVAFMGIAVPLLLNYIKSDIINSIDEHFQYISAFLGLGWLIISEQIAETKERKIENDKVLQKIQDLYNDVPHFIKFERSLTARAYIKANSSICKSIYNTRINKRPSDERDQVLIKERKGQDDAIRLAIKNGVNYHIVYDTSYSEQKNDIETWYGGLKTKHKGRLTTSEMVMTDAPLIQFTVLDFGDRSEVLLGWVVRDQNSISQEIFLIRSTSVSEYFKKLFNVYAEAQ